MTVQRHNCFDVLRLALASAVIYGHSFTLGYFASDPLAAATGGRVGLAPDAVLGFFGLSGYLIAASWDRSRSVLDFMLRRIWRIVPGFWACLLGTAFLLAPVIDRHEGAFPIRSAFDFVWRNAALHLHRAFVGSASAGNLWSIWPEFTCYLAVAALGILGGIASDKILLVLALVGLALVHGFFASGAHMSVLPAHLALSLRELTPYYLAFVVGVALHRWSVPLIVARGRMLLILAGLALTASFGGYALLSPILIPWFLVSFGENFVLRLPVDISYGTYLYGFAIQQLLISLPWFRHCWLIFFGSSLLAALGAGWLSWPLVERHFRVKSLRNDSASCLSTIP